MKKKFSKIISSILVLTICFSTCAMTQNSSKVSAASNSKETKYLKSSDIIAINSTTKNINLQFYSNLERNSIKETTCQWSDEWFNIVSSNYNHDLATTSIVMSKSVYNINAKTTIDKNFSALGFTNFENVQNLNYKDPDYGINQVGYSIANKKITLENGSSSDLIYLVVRGTNGTFEEWSSNVNVADTNKTAMPYHEGFFKASKQVEEALTKYISSNNLDTSNARIIVTGHSRGAAVSNLIGASLNDGNVFKKDNVYVFTFATPNSCLYNENIHSDKYNNIFNIVNPEDLVPIVPLGKNYWGYDTYGKTCVLPSAANNYSDYYNGNKKYFKMNDIFKTFSGNKDYSPFASFVLVRFVPTFLYYVVANSTKGYYKKFSIFSSISNIAKKIGINLNTDDKNFHGFVVALLSKCMVSSSALDSELSRGEFIDETLYIFFEYFRYLPKSIQSMLKKDSIIHMHTCETYISWMKSGSPDSIFVENSSPKSIVLERQNMSNVTVRSKSGEVICNVENGIITKNKPDSDLTLYMESQNIDTSICSDMENDGIWISLPGDNDYTLEFTALNAGIEAKVITYNAELLCENEKYYQNTSIPLGTTLTLNMDRDSVLDPMTSPDYHIPPSDTINETEWVNGLGDSWKYLKNNNILTSWQNNIPGWNGNWFYFDEDGFMAKDWINEIPGWEQNWFYFNDNGTMATGWKLINNNWYFFGSNGVLYTNTTTPDGYSVNANGECVS